MLTNTCQTLHVYYSPTPSIVTRCLSLTRVTTLDRLHDREINFRATKLLPRKIAAPLPWHVLNTMQVMLLGARHVSPVLSTSPLNSVDLRHPWCLPYQATTISLDTTEGATPYSPSFQMQQPVNILLVLVPFTLLLGHRHPLIDKPVSWCSTLQRGIDLWI